MDEDLAIIDSNTRVEKIKNFLKNNKKIIIIVLISIILILMGFFGIKEFKSKQKIDISNLYNSAIINFSNETKEITKNELLDIINKKDTTYSPLSLYFLIDNNLISNKGEINNLFDILINETSLEKEIMYLIIYKKALFNADQAQEGDLLNILNPLINSKSVWKSHALYLMAEYFYAKDQKQKSKEFFNQIISLEISNSDLRLQAEKRLNRDLSE
jgi:predicted negative regulator of RcsB-dependent stress response